MMPGGPRSSPILNGEGSYGSIHPLTTHLCIVESMCDDGVSRGRISIDSWGLEHGSIIVVIIFIMHHASLGFASSSLLSPVSCCVRHHASSAIVCLAAWRLAPRLSSLLM